MNGNESATLCTTQACIHVASEMLWNLAPNYTEINPCTDFARYACGNWANRHDIPAGQQSTDVLSAASDMSYNVMKQIVMGPYPTDSNAGWISLNLTEDQVMADKENFEKLQHAYQVCMDYPTQEADGLEPLAAFVKQVVDTFPDTPASTNASGQTYDHSAAMGRVLTIFESLGMLTTQSIFVKQNLFDPNESHLAIWPPSTPDPVITPDVVPKYLQLASTLISAVHPANLTLEKASSLVAAAWDFQGKADEALSTAAADPANNLADPILHYAPTTSLSEVQKLAPQLNFKYVVSQLAPKGFEGEHIAMPLLAYYGNLSQIISETSADVLQTFFVWKAITSLAIYVESDLTNDYNKLRRLLNAEDPETPKPRSQRCLEFLDAGPDWAVSNSGVYGQIGPTGLTWILSRFFVDRFYSSEAKTMTSEILDSLKAAFLERLEEKDWISPKVKEAAAEKVHNMTNRIGLPTDPDVVDPVAANLFYADFNTTSSQLVNALSLAKVDFSKKWASLGKPFQRGQLKVSTLLAGAYQDFQLNTIAATAGIQQFPMYDVGFPPYLLYGSIGLVVGHEITHGFDNTGRLFDASGNLTNWWDDTTAEIFVNKTECFIDQAEQYTITAPNGTQVPINGLLTLGENIADAGGAEMSFRAWKTWERENGSAKSLPSLEQFTHDQLFFLKMGQTWCSRMPPEALVRHVQTDVHSPRDARIMITLSNSAGFKDAFNCPNKEPVCEIW